MNKRLIVEVLSEDFKPIRTLIDSDTTDFVKAFKWADLGEHFNSPEDHEPMYVLTDEHACMGHFASLAGLDGFVFSGDDAGNFVDRATGRSVYSVAHWFENGATGETVIIRAEIYQD